jgi:hypothetical protein
VYPKWLYSSATVSALAFFRDVKPFEMVTSSFKTLETTYLVIVSQLGKARILDAADVKSSKLTYV